MSVLKCEKGDQSKSLKNYFPKRHEPTCGLGAFLEASLNTWGNKIPMYGYEISKDYIEEFEKRYPDAFDVTKICHADFFNLDLEEVCHVSDKPFVIGNPPWVTNSQLGVLNSTNLPAKSNIKGFTGFEAMSGKSNFDISEWMITRVTEELSKKEGVLAMLCKTSVARNVFLHNFKTDVKNVKYQIFRIDSKKEFDVSVDACLFVVDFLSGGDETKCEIFSGLDYETYDRSIGIANGKIVADIDLHLETQELAMGKSPIVWRSGVKHDASKVMELKICSGKLLNGFGDEVKIEGEYLYPLLKSSDVANQRLRPRRYLIVTQKKVGEDTLKLMSDAPYLWKYLESNSEKLDGRKSSIYKKLYQTTTTNLNSSKYR
jgi:hypothetical protein